MKKLNLIIVAAGAAFMMQACHNSGTSITTDSTTTTTADVTKTDTSKMVAAVPADTADVSFATQSAAGGMTEIALSKLELQSANAKVKDFANMMVTDHTDAGNKLMAIAKSKNITLPNGPNAAQQQTISDMSKKSGAALDKAYVAQMVTDHKNTIALFEGAEKTVKDTTLKSFITTTLPTLHKHLDAITAIKGSM